MSREACSVYLALEENQVHLVIERATKVVVGVATSGQALDSQASSSGQILSSNLLPNYGLSNQADKQHIIAELCMTKFEEGGRFLNWPLGVPVKTPLHINLSELDQLWAAKDRLRFMHVDSNQSITHALALETRAFFSSSLAQARQTKDKLIASKVGFYRKTSSSSSSSSSSVRNATSTAQEDTVSTLNKAISSIDLYIATLEKTNDQWSKDVKMEEIMPRIASRERCWNKYATPFFSHAPNSI
eukprot:g34963.t1